MKTIKKVIAVLTAAAIALACVPSGYMKEARASGAYLIKLSEEDTYLYASGGSVAAGALKDGDKAYRWIISKMLDGSYWIQNQETASYMCLENQKENTGTVDLISQIYEVWDSAKWVFDPERETTIKNRWKNPGCISVSGTSVEFGTAAPQFNFVPANSLSAPQEPFVTGGVADGVTLPAPNDDLNSVGADMPYIRYDSRIALLGGGATLETSEDFAAEKIASQASEQSYINLPYSGAYAEWTTVTAGDGVTMRFTMPDSGDGTGLDGSLDVYVNNVKVRTVDLTSYFMWQYFPKANPEDEPGGTAAFAFDEVHFRLDTPLKAGDRIRIQSSGDNGLSCGVDFLETEVVPEAIEKPADAYSVLDYGAAADDGKSDYQAIYNCIASANRDGKDVYIPEGTFHLDRMLKINATGIKITGAGIWYTNLKFTNASAGGGGISGSDANNVEFCDMYINSNLRSRYNENAVYKCFMDVWTGGSYIHDIWEDHFECGFWFADYNGAMSYCDGVKVANCRIRDNFADGVNFCRGTSHAAVYNCSVRNNGDDGLAMWNESGGGAKDESDNIFCYNTIEFIWRAGGVAIYGGNRHQIYNNYIADTFKASGIHANTVFPGYKFTGNDDGTVFSNNILIRTGCSADYGNSALAAVDIMDSGVRNFIFRNTYIYESQHDAVRLEGSPQDMLFENLYVYATGKDGRTTSGDNTGALFKFSSKSAVPYMRVNGLAYSDVAYSGVIYGSRTNSEISGETSLGTGYAYEIPAGRTKSSSKSTTAALPEQESNNPGNPQKPGTGESGKPDGVQQNGSAQSGRAVKVKKTRVKKVAWTKKHRKVKITLKKIKGVTGYQVKYSASKKMKKRVKTVRTKKPVVTVKKLVAGKKYYFKARAFKKVSGKRIYGAWSKVKKVKLKK